MSTRDARRIAGLAVLLALASLANVCSSDSSEPSSEPSSTGGGGGASDVPHRDASAQATPKDVNPPPGIVGEAGEVETPVDDDAAVTPAPPEGGDDPLDATIQSGREAASFDARDDVVSDADDPRDADRETPSGSSRGCGTNTSAPNASTQQTMQVGGKTRYFLLYVPSGYSSSKPMPLIFAMHGRGGNNVWAAAPPDKNDWYGRLALKEATAGQAIIAYPQGSGDAPGNSPSFSGTSGWGDEDLPFYDALFAEIKSKYCINTKRVFAAGYSMGGMFSSTLACQRASDIRAIAPIAGWGPGSAPTGTMNSCPTATGKIADMHTHGTKDMTIPFATGRASAEFWRTTNGCSAQSAASSVYQHCESFAGCPGGREVHFCSHSGDHQVPSFAGANIWKFFNSLPDL